jgi:DNA adenine methylase
MNENDLLSKSIKNKKTIKKKILDGKKIILVKENDNYDKKLFIKPILKWVGGKNQILDNIISEFPNEIDNYYEIFLGGGSILFALLSLVKNNIIKINNKILAYDLNEPLVNFYKNLQKHPNEFYNMIQDYISKYNNIEIMNDKNNRKPENEEQAIKSKESYYYWIRQNYNNLTKEEKNDIIGSAMFLFLNKTGFRGLFRVGPNGFNVPFGNYKNPEIINKEHLFEISELIQNVEFKHLSFNESLSNNFSNNDFIYLDPPYAPENEKSFVSYTENGFNLEDNINLFTKCNELNEKNIKFIMSNADVKLVRDNFDNKFKITSILCKRTINSKNPESKTKEVIIKNF